MMSLVSRLWRSIENPNVPLSQATADQWFGDDAGGESYSGVSVTRESVLTFSPVWRGVFVIANAVARLPLYVYERSADGEGKTYADRHPAYRLLRRKPNAETTSFIFRQRMTAVAIVEGNAHAWINRRGSGDPAELIPLPAGSCHPVRVNGALWYVYTPPGEKPRKLPAADVLHIKGPGLDALCGYRLYDKGKNSIGAGMAAEEYAGRFYKNGAEPRVVFESDDDVEPAQAEEIKAAWGAMHSGLENSHKTAILKNGLKIKAFGIDPEKAQLIETRKFSPTNVANWLLLPVHLVGGEGKSSYASLEQENASFLDHSLDPHLVNWEEECYEKLLTEEQKATETHTIEFMRQAMMRVDASARGNFYHNGLLDGWLNRDEVRARENLNPIKGDEGKKFFMPANMVIVGDPESEPEPVDEEEDDAEPMEAVRAATRKVLVDAVRRMARRLVVHAGKAAKSGDVASFLDADIDGHRAVMLDAVGPAAEAYAAAGGKADAAALADALCARIRAGLAAPEPDAFLAAFEARSAEIIEPENPNGA